MYAVEMLTDSCQLPFQSCMLQQFISAYFTCKVLFSTSQIGRCLL